MALTTHPHVAPMLKSRAIHLLPLLAFVTCCRVNFTVFNLGRPSGAYNTADFAPGIKQTNKPSHPCLVEDYPTWEGVLIVRISFILTYEKYEYSAESFTFVKICGLSRLPNLVRSLSENSCSPSRTGIVKCSLLFVTNATQFAGDKQILADPKFFSRKCCNYCSSAWKL